jgi:SAM-dependent methyltransferase
MSFDWREYWSRYRRGVVRSEDDLFVHVGKTVGGQRLSEERFAQGLEHVARALALEPRDEVFEWCCGNGLVTAGIAERVAHITATDFSSHLIEEAERFNGRGNISYRVADARAPLEQVLDPGRRPTKWLMSAALAYFGVADLSNMLRAARERSAGELRMLFTDVPDAGRKFHFYSTEAYRQRHEANERAQPDVNEGMGRWWARDELEEAARATGFALTISDQPADGSTYRMDALFVRAG